MGAWGYGIRQDDHVLDIVGAFDDCLKKGGSLGDATSEVTSRFGASGGDDADPLVWIAIADLQWLYGQLDPLVLARVKEDFESGRSLAAWTEDQRGLVRRRAVLERFIEKIATVNPRPKRPPKTIIRARRFEPGDCLSIRLPDGRYAAALVLAADHSTIEYGLNLVGVLDYLAPEKPTLDVYRARKWLVLTHGNFNGQRNVAWHYPMGFRAVRDRIEVVGRVEILESDPRESSTYCRWNGVGEQVIQQREWDAKESAPEP